MAVESFSKHKKHKGAAKLRSTCAKSLFSKLPDALHFAEFISISRLEWAAGWALYWNCRTKKLYGALGVSEMLNNLLG
jgi:hypothetical protein